MRRRKNNDLILYIIIIFIIGLIMYFSYDIFKGNNLIPDPDINNSHFNGDNNDIFTAIFSSNGADSISKKKIVCEIIDGRCQITLPEITKKNGKVLGWNTLDAKYAIYKPGEIITIENNVLFYAITYKENHLYIDDSRIDYISDQNISCRTYNKEESCMVTIPNYNKIGYENRGYSLRTDSLTGTFFPNDIYILKKDATLYPIYSTLSRGRVINTNVTLQRHGITIEIENGCKEKVYNKYLSYLDSINKNANYLLIGSKITFLNDSTFNQIWGKEYLGMNYGPNDLRLFDVRCSDSSNSDYYATMVHELAHTWDFYYGNHFDNIISEQNDIRNLYNKYLNSVNRPFRDYSYTNIKEFFADSVRYYYLKYIDPKDYFKNLSYPDDVKSVLEKYICIAKNNYQKGSC